VFTQGTRDKLGKTINTKHISIRSGNMGMTLDFVKNFINTRYEDIPVAAVEAARKEVLDSLATALGGSSKPGVGELVNMVKEWGGRPQSTIIAYGIKCPAPSAAQVNGTMIHALDYDDGHPVALVHIGCVAVSTCFAVAERMHGINGKEFITAIALGGDFLSRLGLASGLKTSALSHGWHPTTLFGFLGAAAMAGKIMGLDEDKMINALGLSYHQCGGAGSGVSDGALAKRMGPGLAARGGITAALMAENGITGERDPLGGRTGLFNTYLQGDFDINKLTWELGKRFEGVNIGDKPYPCCGFTHPFIDAALDLKSKLDIDAEQIKEIKLVGGQSAYGLSQPPEIKSSPRTIVDAQFSVPWTVATALVVGKVTLADFTETTIKREKVRELARKITAELDDKMTKHGVGPGKVSIKMKDGTEYAQTIEHCLGSVENPMTYNDCAKKFRECAVNSRKAIKRDQVENVIELIGRLERLDDASEIIRLLA
jgi:2-methylcitrate dehydratase PrpD